MDPVEFLFNWITWHTSNSSSTGIVHLKVLLGERIGGCVCHNACEQQICTILALLSNNGEQATQ